MKVRREKVNACLFC